MLDARAAWPFGLRTSDSGLRRAHLLVALLTLGVLLSRIESLAVLANAWHIPDNSSDLGFNMRNPQFEIGPNSTVTIYQGVQKHNNPYGIANQTGGTLYYKGLTQGAWSSTSLLFHLNGGPSPRLSLFHGSP